MLRIKLILTALWILGTCIGQGATQEEAADRQTRFYKYYQFSSLVKGGSIEPNWMPDGNSFWYAEGAPAETVIYKVDPVTDEVAPLFDTERLRKALEPRLGHEPPYMGLPFDEFTFEGGDRKIKFEVEEREFTLDLDSYVITPARRLSEQEKERTTAKVVRKGFTAGEADVKEIRSPDKRWFAGEKDGNLYLRSCLDNREILLTESGTEDLKWKVGGTLWSADSMKLVVTRVDTSDVARLPVVHWLKTVEEVEWFPFTKAGGKMPRIEIQFVDILTKKSVKVEGTGLEDHYFYPLAWKEDQSEVFFLRMDREFKQLALLTANAKTGKTRTLVEEKSETFIYGLRFFYMLKSLFTPIGDGERFVWLSERDGWNHLYLYDYKGSEPVRLTRGTLPVERVVAVDKEGGWVYFTAHGGEDPYDTHLYRVDFTGRRFLRLTVEPGQHAVEFSPSKIYFLDTHSTTARPPRVDLRRADGKHVRVVSEADIEGLKEIDWSPPETFVVKAADGKTDLHGVLYKPPDFDPKRKYPVLDHIYNGPFITWVPRTFDDPRGIRAGALTRLGFIVMIVDGRGTIWRGKAFQDVVYRNFGRNEIPDHVAALKSLANARPYMDLDRVGIFGSSWGGYMTLRAMVTHPDVYHAGAATCPVSDLYDHASIPIEGYMGTPQNNREGYEYASNIRLASKLRGKLLIMHGTSDVNATFSATMKMVGALVKAKKEHELVVVPEADHGFQGNISGGEYVMQYERRFFERHLEPEKVVLIEE